MTPAQIKKALGAMRLSKKAFAAEFGISPRTLEGWLQGRPLSKTAHILFRTRLLMSEGKTDTQIRAVLKRQA